LSRGRKGTLEESGGEEESDLLGGQAHTEEVAVNGSLHVERTADVDTVLIQGTACRTGCRITGGDTNIFMTDEPGTTDPGDRIAITALVTGPRRDAMGENTTIGTPTFGHATFVVLTTLMGHRVTRVAVADACPADPVRTVFEDALPFVSTTV